MAATAKSSLLLGVRPVHQMNMMKGKTWANGERPKTAVNDDVSRASMSFKGTHQLSRERSCPTLSQLQSFTVDDVDMKSQKPDKVAAIDPSRGDVSYLQHIELVFVLLRYNMAFTDVLCGVRWGCCSEGMARAATLPPLL